MRERLRIRPLVGPTRLSMILVLLALPGCEEGAHQEASHTPDAGGAEPREVWTLSEEPLVQIGVRDGEEPYELHNASGSVRLDDGRIVVANGGSQELRYFGADGSYLFSVGEDGEGPGEFRRPTRVRRAGRDTLLVWDQRLRRVSYFHPEGEFLGSTRLVPRREELFPADEWLFEGFLIDSPVPPDAREPIRRVVRTLPRTPPRDEVWFVRVTQEGRLWVSERHPPADTALTWTVYDLDGAAVARVRTPPRFELHEITHDHVLGLFLDHLDVNYIRLYALNKPEGSPPGSGLELDRVELVPPPPSVRTAEEEAALAPVKSLVKHLASLEEIHYASHYGYTSDAEALLMDLGRELTQGLTVNILYATRQGWAGAVTHDETGVRCVLAYGHPTPMGWAGGEVICP